MEFLREDVLLGIICFVLSKLETKKTYVCIAHTPQSCTSNVWTEM